MTLMVTVIYNDLTRIAWIENLMPGARTRVPRKGAAGATVLSLTGF